MFVVGIDISVIMIEWIIIEFFCYFECMKKVCEELDFVVGFRVVKEEDFDNLFYLNVVLKEFFCFYFVILLGFFCEVSELF